MQANEETNVRLPPCAFEALAVVAARRGVSRDEAVRQLLAEHVRQQESRQPENRLTHVSAVLRYPPVPQAHGDPRTDRPLRMRLVAGMTERARAVSLRLPGQSLRAHSDYQARLLTDAVMTAIAVQEPFSDEFLDGLLPLLRHAAAGGLWQLAVAATSTAPENVILDAAREALGAEASPSRRRLLLVAEALNEDVAWHAPSRFQVAANIARDILVGPRAVAGERLLYEQRAEWNAICQDLRSTGSDARARYQRGTYDSDWTGRGGAAAWRAERRVEVQDFEEWLIDCSESGHFVRDVSPPGWRVRVPGGWRAYLSPGEALPEPYATWASTRRVLAFPAGAKQAAWPLVQRPGGPGLMPVPGIEQVLAAAEPMRPERVSSFIESVLVDWSGEDDHPDFPVRLNIPAHEAFALGFIDSDQRRQVMAEARAETLLEMKRVIGSLRVHQGHRRAGLEQAMGNARLFRQLAGELGIDFRVVKATWTWPGRSVLDEIPAGTRGDVQWLAAWAHKTCTRMLQWSMDQAWREAFENRPADYWLPGRL